MKARTLVNKEIKRLEIVGKYSMLNDDLKDINREFSKAKLYLSFLIDEIEKGYYESIDDLKLFIEEEVGKYSNTTYVQSLLLILSSIVSEEVDSL